MSPTIIDLNKMLNTDDNREIQRMELEFQLNGWCFVRLPLELIPNETLISGLSKFFQMPSGSKDRYSQEVEIYGYSKVNHKEGIKILTEKYFNNFAD